MIVATFVPWVFGFFGLLYGCEIYVISRGTDKKSFWLLHDKDSGSGIRSDDCLLKTVEKALIDSGFQPGPRSMFYELADSKLLYLDGNAIAVNSHSVSKIAHSGKRVWLKFPDSKGKSKSSNAEPVTKFIESFGLDKEDPTKGLKIVTPTAAVVQESSPTRAGIKNTGVSCFINTAIQLLYNVTPFREILNEYASKTTEDVAGDMLFWRLKQVFDHLSTGKLVDISTINKFIERYRPMNLSISTNEILKQSDSFETIQYILDAIEGELGQFDDSHKWMNSSLYPIFGQSVKIGKECSNANHPKLTSSISRSLFMNISIPGVKINGLASLKATIMEQHRTSLLHPDVPPHGHTHDCDILERRTITHLPSYLFVNVPKLFDHSFWRKSSVDISFPLYKLDLSELCQNPLVPDEKFVYDLVGVGIHTGSGTSGHYYAYVKSDGKPAKWSEMNDMTTTEIDILKKKKNIRANASYFLYRRRIDSKEADRIEEELEVSSESASPVENPSNSKGSSSPFGMYFIGGVVIVFLLLIFAFLWNEATPEPEKRKPVVKSPPRKSAEP